MFLSTRKILSNAEKILSDAEATMQDIETVDRLQLVEIEKPTAFGYHFTNRPTNIVENKENYVIEIPMTGIPKENITVELVGRNLNISGTSKKKTTAGKNLVNKLSKQDVRAVYTVPQGTKESDIDVKVENGLLVATIKKNNIKVVKARIEIK